MGVAETTIWPTIVGGSSHPIFFFFYKNFVMFLFYFILNNINEAYETRATL
jgi:hypothetical protein